MQATLNRLFSVFVLSLTLMFAPFGFAASPEEQGGNLRAEIHTNYGHLEVELFSTHTPATVDNFVAYANSGFYDGTLFHRVIPDFMIQGGGFEQNMARKNTREPIRNEANPKLKNLRGTLSMARTNNPHSATSQFFINVVDNHYLDASERQAGYAVFGKVIKGMEVADTISRVATTSKQGMQNVPVKPVIIERILVQTSE